MSFGALSNRCHCSACPTTCPPTFGLQPQPQQGALKPTSGQAVSSSTAAAFRPKTPAIQHPLPAVQISQRWIPSPAVALGVGHRISIPGPNRIACARRETSFRSSVALAWYLRHCTSTAPGSLRRTATPALFRSTTLPAVAAPKPSIVGADCGIAVLRYCARLEHLDNLERGERRAETAGHPTRALALAPALAAGRRIDERIASCQSR